MPRYETRAFDGYERVRAYPSDTVDGSERYVYVHRLAAVAWGVLDGLDDDRHVHHSTEVPWYNAEGNLEAVDETDHGHLTQEQRERRRSRV